MKKERSPLFDILKGAAILMVCITHFAWKDAERVELLFPFWVSMAVPIFMVVTGYLTSASYDRRDWGLQEPLRWKHLRGKLWQYLRPFGAVFLVELVLESLWRSPVPLGEAAVYFVTGGIGKYGTYYVPILLQMLLIFPVIYALVRRDRRNIVWCFLANLLYELGKDTLGITAYGYRLLAFRYVFLISMGCYLYFERGRFPLGKYLLMAAVGVGYILLVSYTDYRTVLFTRWARTSMMTAFYVIPVTALLLKRCSKVHIPVLERIGQASYHIFLMQILYYNYFKGFLPIEHRMANMAVGVAICLLSGYLYFLLDRKVTSAAKDWISRGAEKVRDRLAPVN